MQEQIGDDAADIEIPFCAEFEEPTAASAKDAEEHMAQDDMADSVLARDLENREFIQSELCKLLPEGSNANELMLDAFRRLSNKQPWIPFRFPDSDSPADDVDKEEAALFHEWSPQYDRNTDGYSSKSYRAFERDWNNEVAKRFSLWTNGSDIVLIRVKSQLQLQENFDKLKSWNALRATAPTQDDNDRDSLNNTLRTSRESLPPMNPPHDTVGPTQYPRRQQNATMPFGNPMTLNSDIAVGAVEGIRDNATAHFA
jgi:hypothetical protein